MVAKPSLFPDPPDLGSRLVRPTFLLDSLPLQGSLVLVRWAVRASDSPIELEPAMGVLKDPWMKLAGSFMLVLLSFELVRPTLISLSFLMNYCYSTVVIV